MRVYIPPKRLYQYWVLTTMDCNLRCRYCFEENKIKGSKPSYDMKDLVRFIAVHNPYFQLKDKRDEFKNGVVFSGGEPMMNQEFMADFIQRTREDLRLEYVLQTNGTLLDKIEPYLLENLDFIFVSIDGPRDMHDKNRGRGTFDKIVNNVRKIKPDYKGQILARITATVDRDFSIYDSIMTLTPDIDNFHWQIETPVSHPVTTEDTDAFLKKYRGDVGKLIDYWIGNLQKGVVKNIVPFQSIVTPVKPGLRCGAGETLIVVDLDGQCYGCDTMAGDPRARIGSIYDGAEPERLHMQLSMNCSGNPLTCESETYKGKPGCLNSCMKCSEEETMKFYCSTVHILVEEIMARRDFINGLMEREEINSENVIMPRMALYTEQIP